MFSSNLMKQMEDKMPKTSYPSINKEDIDNFLVPIPSLSEQKEIVSQIEKLEGKINKLQETIKQIPKLKEAILKKYL